MQRFYLERVEDKSGVSGTGIVAAGCIFPSGKVVMEWLVAPYLMTSADSFPALLGVHGHGGATVPVFVDTVAESREETPVVFTALRRQRKGEIWIIS